MGGVTARGEGNENVGINKLILFHIKIWFFSRSHETTLVLFSHKAYAFERGICFLARINLVFVFIWGIAIEGLSIITL
jgi:hypothetical protein